MSGFGWEQGLCGKVFILFLANNPAVFCSITDNLNKTEFKCPRNLFPQGQHTESAVIQGSCSTSGTNGTWLCRSCGIPDMKRGGNEGATEACPGAGVAEDHRG